MSVAHTVVHGRAAPIAAELPNNPSPLPQIVPYSAQGFAAHPTYDNVLYRMYCRCYVCPMDKPSPNDPPIVSAVHALRLMREALDLLDLAGASLAARQLQHAIGTLDPASLIECEE